MALELSSLEPDPGLPAEQAAGKDRMELRARPEAVRVTRSPGPGPRRAVALRQASPPAPRRAPTPTPRRCPRGARPRPPRAPPDRKRVRRAGAPGPEERRPLARRPGA